MKEGFAAWPRSMRKKTNEMVARLWRRSRYGEFFTKGTRSRKAESNGGNKVSEEHSGLADPLQARTGDEQMYLKTGSVCLFVVAILMAAFGQAQAETPPWAKVSPEQVEAANKLGVPVAFENSVGMRFVLIPSGKSMMGSRDSAAEVARRCAMPNAQPGWFYDEHPAHEVTLTNSFYMAIHELSQDCYDRVTKPKPAGEAKEPPKEEANADEKPDPFKGPDKPVLNVSWEEAQRLCQTLSGLEAEKGRKYGIPTEAEWEYVCRAGSTTPFSFGETSSTDKANYNGDYTYGEGSQKGENRGMPVPVGSLPANAWGLHEMHGNLSEWCADWYGEYGSEAVSNPRGPESGGERVIRGGSWRSYPGACRSACRLRNGPGTKSNHIGFRVRCSLPLPAKPEKAE